MGNIREVNVQHYMAENAKGKDPSELTEAAVNFSSVTSGPRGKAVLELLKTLRTEEEVRWAVAFADSFRICQNFEILAAAFAIPREILEAALEGLRCHTAQASGMPTSSKRVMSELAADAIRLSEAAHFDLQEVLRTALETGGNA